jgi:hypothetical protein
MPLSDDSLKQMRQQIDAALVAHRAAMAAPAMAAATPQSVQGDFCTLWPNAKPILDTISGVVVFIPGVGAAAGPILKTLVTIGDQIYGSTCQAGH